MFLYKTKLGNCFIACILQQTPNISKDMWISIIVLSFYERWIYLKHFMLHGVCRLASIVETTILVPYSYGKSLQPMMTSSNANIFCVTGPLWGESIGHRWIPSQKPVTQSFDISLICVWTNGWAKNPDAGDMRRHRAYYAVIAIPFKDRIPIDLIPVYKRLQWLDKYGSVPG